MITKSGAKFEEKLFCLFQKWQEFGKFSSEHLKVSKLVFHGILFSKVENAWATTYGGVTSNDTKEW